MKQAVSTRLNPGWRSVTGDVSDGNATWVTLDEPEKVLQSLSVGGNSHMVMGSFESDLTWQLNHTGNVNIFAAHKKKRNLNGHFSFLRLKTLAIFLSNIGGQSGWLKNVKLPIIEITPAWKLAILGRPF